MLSVNSSVPIVFCEGLKDSLDPVFIHQIIPPGQVEIRPVGGKLSMRAFIEGYLTDYNQSQNYIGFRDRDFDVEPPSSPKLIRLEGQKPIFMTYRASIESYLIDASLLHQYWAYHAANSPVWKYGNPPSVIRIETIIENAAEQLADYQAIRWALAKLKPGQRWPEIRTTWMKGGSGHLPTSLAYDNCLLKANNLVDKFFT